MRGTIILSVIWFLLSLTVRETAIGGDGKSQEETGHFPRTGTFTGRVLTPEGDPIRGALITLPDESGGPPFGSAKSNAEGKFSLEIEDNPDHTIHRTLRKLLIVVEGRGTAYVPGRDITLFPGQDKPLGNIIVDPGQIYRGRVINNEGEPIAEALVRSQTLSRGAGYVGSVPDVRTDAKGLYETPLLPVGQHYLTVEAEGYLTRMHFDEAFRSVGADGMLPDLILEADKPIPGVLKDEKGEPIAEAVVRAYGYTTKTDAQGKFVLRGFGEDAKFQLQIRVDGYVTIDWGVHVTPDGIQYYEVKKLPPPPFIDKSIEWESFKKALDAVSVTIPKLEITMEPTASIRGQVTDAETGQPVKISQIVLCMFARKDNGEVVLSACRNSSFTQTKTGEFAVSYSFPTEYHLTIEADGYETAEAFTPKVAKLEDIPGIQVKMTKRKTETIQPASFQQRLTGTVKVGGELLKSARVGLWMPPRQFNAINSHMVRGRTTHGDGNVLASTMLSDGRFSLDVPFQGENWYVIVETPARVVALQGPIRIAQGKTNHIDLTAQSPGGVRGRVANNSAVDLPLWAVLFSKSGLQYETRVQKDGAFEFKNVLPGDYGLKVGCETIRDSEVPRLPDIQNVTLEESFELALIPSVPWKRATRIMVEGGKTTDGILVTFQP